MQQTPSRTSDNDSSLGGALSAVVLSASFIPEAWLRSGFGCRYIGWKGPFGLFLMAWPGFLLYRHDPKLPLVCFGAGYTLFWIVYQLGAWIRLWRKNLDRHTLYCGRPHLCRLLPFMGELAVKRLEPFLVLLLAYEVFHLNRPLGACLATSGLALLFTTTCKLHGERKRTLDLSDAVKQQRVTAENFRAMQN